MLKASALFKIIRYIKEPFHAWIGRIKERNGKGLTEEEKIMKWQEYTEEQYN